MHAEKQLVFFVLACLVSSLVFCQENLSPQNSTVALGQNGTFLCTAKKEIFWKVTPDRSSEGPFVRAERPNQEPTRPEIENFNISGLFISSAMTNETYTSHLILEGSNANNFTKVECAIFGRAFPTFAVLRVFGLPTPPVLQASPQGRNVNVSWLPSFSPYSVSITYELELTDSSGVMLHHTATDSTSFIYIPPEDFCSTLRIGIFAFNNAGISNESVLVYNMLTEPNTEAIATSIKHEVLFLNGQLTSKIEFDAVRGCPDYPVEYILVLQEAMSNESVILGPSTELVFFINSSYIKENARYSYVVEAVNTINIRSAIDPREFFTTDVQAAMATVTCNSVIFQCAFSSGSRNKGCFLKLSINGSVITHNIERVNSSNSVQEEVDIVVSTDEINIEAFDLESDGSIGDVSVSVQIDSNCSDVSPPFTTFTTFTTSGSSAGPDSTEDGFPYLIPVIAAVPAGVLLFLLITITCCACCICVHKKEGMNESRSKRDDTQPAVLNAYKSSSVGHFNLTEDEASKQHYSQLSHPYRHTQAGPDCVYYQIEESGTDQDPIYSELTNHTSLAISDGHYSQPDDYMVQPDSSQPGGDGYYSQLRQEGEYAVLENNRTSTFTSAISITPSLPHSSAINVAPPLPPANATSTLSLNPTIGVGPSEPLHVAATINGTSATPPPLRHTSAANESFSLAPAPPQYSEVIPSQRRI